MLILFFERDATKRFVLEFTNLVLSAIYFNITAL